MTAASNYLEIKALDHILGKGARNFTSPANLFVALFTGSAGTNLEDGSTTSNEVSDANYLRQAITFNAASGTSPCSASNSAQVSFAAAAANIGEITHMAIMDASTGGNVLFYGAITNPREIFAQDSFTIPAAAISVQLA